MSPMNKENFASFPITVPVLSLDWFLHSNVKGSSERKHHSPAPMRTFEILPLSVLFVIGLLHVSFISKTQHF